MRPLALLAALLPLACAGPGHDQDRDREPLELVVLSYNIKRGLGNDGVTDIERTAEWIRRQDADLVALQEIDVGVERSGVVDQLDVLSRLTGLEGRFGAFMPYQGGEYGIALLSRFPIRASANHPLPDGAEPRTALDARVELPTGEELVLCSVHFYRTEEERLAQARAVADLYARAEVPMVLAGDFNSTPGSPVMDLVEEHWVDAEKGEDRFTFSATEPRTEIDFVLYRPAERFEVVSVDVLDEAVISDHRPVRVVLRLLAEGR